VLFSDRSVPAQYWAVPPSTGKSSNLDKPEKALSENHAGKWGG
jgi:hypothetical protein